MGFGDIGNIGEFNVDMDIVCGGEIKAASCDALNVLAQMEADRIDRGRPQAKVSGMSGGLIRS